MDVQIRNRVVFYSDSRPLPAIVRAVHSNTNVDLFVLDDATDILDCEYSETLLEDHWSWPGAQE